ncbi:nuclear speckle splicing regulatory protein 1-like [Lytechinus variegatus]|uniref:nuclear speckle splicing regulatory protein 1-like n=1 Tax=Lytechinus variegatus TaxID=7654 RepID=UPI001BB270D9|nr:nuclear speckle splicing regulatory protein 1-like [Lytechinus variegatus]
MAFPGKQYGLITKAKKSSAPALKKASIFNESSDEEENVTTLEMQKKRQAAMQTKIKKQTQLEIQRALEADPTVYEYDSIYDDMEKKKEEKLIASKKKTDGNKPKYIESLLKSAELRKKEQERRKERKIQKEREKEGEMYGDKEAFVTSAYKKKMQELAEEEERERKEAEEEAANDVMKQSDLSGFYRHILSQTTGDVKVKEEKSSDDEGIKRKVMAEVEKKPFKTERHSGLNLKARDKSDSSRHQGNIDRHRRGASSSDDDDDDYRHIKDRQRRDVRDSAHRHSRNERRDDRRTEKYKERRDEPHQHSSSHRRDDSRGRHGDGRRHDNSNRRGGNERDRHWHDGRDSCNDRQEGKDNARKEREVKSERTEIREKPESSKEGSKMAEKLSPVANPDADSDFEIDSEDSDVEKAKPALDKAEVTSKVNSGKKEANEDEEAKYKFVKRTGNETVISARDRYLARKAARDVDKTHVNQQDGSDDRKKERENTSKRNESRKKADSLKEDSRQPDRVTPVANPDADSDFEIDSEDSDVEKAKPALDKLGISSSSTRDLQEREDIEEAKSKFVKRTGSETVMSARDRYLARKAARDSSKTHVSREDN